MASHTQGSTKLMMFSVCNSVCVDGETHIVDV